jgi:hypothetical protein
MNGVTIYLNYNGIHYTIYDSLEAKEGYKAYRNESAALEDVKTRLWEIAYKLGYPVKIEKTNRS